MEALSQTRGNQDLKSCSFRIIQVSTKFHHLQGIRDYPLTSNHQSPQSSQSDPCRSLKLSCYLCGFYHPFFLWNLSLAMSGLLSVRPLRFQAPVKAHFRTLPLPLPQREWTGTDGSISDHMTPFPSCSLGSCALPLSIHHHSS